MKLKIQFPKDTANQIVKSVVKAQGVITDDVKGVINQALLAIESKAKTLTPVDTGRLRASIHAVSVGKPDEFGYYKDKKGNTFDGKFKTATAGTNTGMVGTNVDYAPVIEYGRELRMGRYYITRATAEIQPRLEDELKKYKYK